MDRGYRPVTTIAAIAAALSTTKATHKKASTT
jgi:hypothetical protein